MVEIDHLRTYANLALANFRRIRDHAGLSIWPNTAEVYAARLDLEKAREDVELALVEWWEQNCKEEDDDHR